MTNARIIELSTDTFDQKNTFGLLIGNTIAKCSAPDYYGMSNRDDFAPFVIQHGGMLKDSYTVADREETTRINTEEPVKNGDVVSINGSEYRVKVLGNYSDPAELVAV